MRSRTRQASAVLLATGLALGAACTKTEQTTTSGGTTTTKGTTASTSPATTRTSGTTPGSTPGSTPGGGSVPDACSAMPAGTAKPVTSDTSISVKVGETFTLVTSANAGTGYSWKAENLPDNQTLKGSGTAHVPCAERPGAPVDYLFTYEAVQAGTTTITLNEFPPGNTTPAKSYKVEVTVT